MENNSSENNSSLTREEIIQRLTDRIRRGDLFASNIDIAYEEHRPIFKLEFNWGKTKPKNPNQPPSDNNPSQEKKS
jgi:hypothetical protein